MKAIVLDGYCVKCADCVNILNTKCKWPNYKTVFGYYELDNAQKYSIFHNPHDDCIYAKGAHFGWGKFDEPFF